MRFQIFSLPEIAKVITQGHDSPLTYDSDMMRFRVFILFNGFLLSFSFWKLAGIFIFQMVELNTGVLLWLIFSMHPFFISICALRFVATIAKPVGLSNEDFQGLFDPTSLESSSYDSALSDSSDQNSIFIDTSEGTSSSISLNFSDDLEIQSWDYTEDVQNWLRRQIIPWIKMTRAIWLNFFHPMNRHFCLS